MVPALHVGTEAEERLDESKMVVRREMVIGKEVQDIPGKTVQPWRVSLPTRVTFETAPPKCGGRWNGEGGGCLVSREKSGVEVDRVGGR